MNTSVPHPALPSPGATPLRPVRPKVPRLSSIPTGTLVKFWPVALLLALHGPLAVAAKISPILGTLHSLAVAGLGLAWVLISNKPITGAYVGGYIVGSEVLWRMTKSQLFWEYGKYLTVLVLVVSMFRASRLRLSTLPVVYFLLLIPSTIKTFAEYPWEESRQLVSSDLSGPLSLMICACFFTGLRLTPAQRLRLFAFIVAPIVGIVSIAIYTTLSAGTLNFTNNSNWVTSGGFAPNQVSSMLGLGALLAFLFIMDDSPKALKVVMFFLVAVFLTQSALTFSRTGLFIAVVTAGCASYYLLQDRAARMKLVLALAAAGVLAAVVAVPMLKTFTDGAIVERFETASTTNRDKIASEDLRLWLENPVLGVGTGQGLFFREYGGGIVATSHTEFTRLLAEHGLPGGVACLFVFYMAWKNFRQARTPRAKAFVSSAIAWTFIFMMSTGMRVVAPAFIFGLTFALFGLPIRPGRRPAAAPKPVPQPGLEALRPTTGAAPA